MHITATVSQDGQECLVMIEDITERKQVKTETKRLGEIYRKLEVSEQSSKTNC